MLDAYLLRKWSRFIKVRDGGECQMCAVRPGMGRVESHHVFPKGLFPELAYELSNGICLCVRCHRGVVHAENTWNDNGNWSKFVPAFELILDDPIIHDFNCQEQHRIARAT